MTRFALRGWAAVLLGFSLLTLPVVAEDAKPSSGSKPPDWTGYTFVTDVVGEVVKADEKGVTIRVTWFEPQIKGGKVNPPRPRLNQNPRNFRNPYQGNLNRPQQPKVTFKEVSHDYDLEFLPQSLVRMKSLPPKLDDKGKRALYTEKELTELRKPLGVTGYAASTADLTPGTIVEVILIRDKTIPAAKVTEDDLKVKYAIILGTNPSAPKDGTPPKKDKK